MTSIIWLALEAGGSSFSLSGSTSSLPFAKVYKRNDAPAFDKGKKDHGCLARKRSRFASPKLFAVKECQLPDFDVVVGPGRF